MAEKALTPKKNNKRPKAYPPGADGKLLDVAAKIGRAKWIVAIVLALSVVLSVIFAGEELSVYNVQYLLKHFDVNSEGNTGNFTTLNYESDAIAACVIGGVSFVGGTGKIGGVVIGVLLLQIIFVGLNFLSVDQNLLYIIKGLIILLACAVDMRKYLAKK